MRKPKGEMTNKQLKAKAYDDKVKAELDHYLDKVKTTGNPDTTELEETLRNLK